MDLDWLHRIAPYPRPSQKDTTEERAFTGRAFHLPGWLEPRRVIYDHQLVLVREGTFRIDVADETYVCDAGTFLIIPPIQWETSSNSGTSRGQRCWCHFDWVYRGSWGKTPIMSYFPALPRSEFARKAPSFVDPRILYGAIPSPRLAFDLFERLLQRQIFGDAHEQLASRSILLELLLHLLDQGERRVVRERSVQLAEAVRQQLKVAVNSGRSMEPIQRILERMRYSAEHLSRIFHAEYGISPMKYVQALRIDQAKLLLQDTSLSISEIAYRVGMNDAGYFSRLFRKVAGLSPSEFRERL